jgi:hypothetical protein
LRVTAGAFSVAANKTNGPRTRATQSPWRESIASRRISIARSSSLEGFGGASYQLLLRENVANLKVHADGAALGDLNHGLRPVTVEFPNLPGYRTKTITFSW